MNLDIFFAVVKHAQHPGLEKYSFGTGDFLFLPVFHSVVHGCFSSTIGDVFISIVTYFANDMIVFLLVV